GGKQGDCAQQRRHRVGLVEELDRQDRGQAPEDVEIVPFNDVPHCSGNHHAAEVFGDLILTGHSVPPSLGLVYLNARYKWVTHSGDAPATFAGRGPDEGHAEGPAPRKASRGSHPPRGASPRPPIRSSHTRSSQWLPRQGVWP